MRRQFAFSPYVLFISLVAALGSFLFGYQTSIISGALLFITEDFSLTVFDQGMLVSVILLGGIAGSICGGFLTDSLGRKSTLFLTAILFVLATFGLYYAHSWTILLLGRFVAGIAVGIVSVAVPLYIAEISPPESRGALVTLNQLLITIGIFVSYLIAFMFAGAGDWRDMFAIALAPAVIQFVCLFFIPETPGWLISHGKSAAAEKVLHRLRLAPAQERLVGEQKRDEGPTKKTLNSLLAPSVRSAFLVGVGISVFQQITGINTVIYYAPRIFQSAGYETAGSALLATVWVGVVNVLMTLVGLWLVDKAGRRALALIGLAGMAISLAVLGSTLSSHSSVIGVVAIISLMTYIASFAIGLGIVAWLIIAEIFPLGIRGRAIGVAVFSNWTCNYIVSLSFLPLINLLGTGLTYWLYTAICLLGIWFVWKMVPETKGKTFEEIQQFWQK